ncbi:flavodoxin family protein [Nocardia otitidiscaviarum]|uniref:flavodoxin family protein n=1 Tax=Nocardia otitidiscaviarum TaxID=1823 RepID=UPI0004A6AF4B|nr:flavodoxin family protein [Nocardia otitidiscaviarum]MBF6131562.1 flavodoxin family protein [Nocardia otitidiscaviarum]MBF6482708.1 flavodoxin family protein [Nocardia otitidiscaviarum]
MSTIAVVYHSGFGHTREQAEAVRRGAAAVPGTEVTLVSVDEYESAWAAIDAADAIIFGTPTYMGGPSAPFKAFLDATSGRWARQQWRDKLAAGFTTSAGVSGDKLATLQALSLFAMQHGMVWVGLGLLPGDFESADDLNRIGGFLGAMAHAPADAAPEIAPGPGDLATAAHLGRRVAAAAMRWTGDRSLARVGS